MTKNSQHYSPADLDKHAHHRELLERRYGAGDYATLHNVPNKVLLNSLEAIIQPDELAGKDIIEIGAGCSLYLKLFLEQGCHLLVANDLSEKALQLNNIQDPRYQALPGDFLTVPIKDNSFDIAFAHLTMMLVVPLFDDFLARAYRILKPGGSFISFDANYLCPVSIYRRYSRGPTKVTKVFSPFELKRRAMRQGFDAPLLVPMTTNKEWTRGSWILGTSFWMRAMKPA